MTLEVGPDFGRQCQPTLQLRGRRHFGGNLDNARNDTVSVLVTVLL